MNPLQAIFGLLGAVIFYGAIAAGLFFIAKLVLGL